MANWSVGVVIPAHNEADTIAECVRSILAAAEVSTRIQALWIVVSADACTDATVSRATDSLRSRGEVIALNARNAGHARRLGTQRALAHFSEVSSERVWLAGTDADSMVRSDWFETQLDAADDGIQGLAGIIELSQASPWTLQVHSAHYPMNADGTHPHVHGANLAFRADAYLDAGGWRDVALAEDHCLWNRLLSRGWRLRSSTKSVVLTSARLDARAEGGFGSTLKARLGFPIAASSAVAAC